MTKKYFDFSKVTREQKGRISRMQDAEKRFIYKMSENMQHCVHTIKAQRYLKLAVMQCNAAILFHDHPSKNQE